MSRNVIVTVLLGGLDRSKYLAGPSRHGVDLLRSLDY
jgi:hypothetical protein